VIIKGKAFNRPQAGSCGALAFSDDSVRELQRSFRTFAE